MKRLALLSLLLIASLLATAALSSVDDSILFSPPAAAAEGFLRELQTERYEEALPYLSEELRSRHGERALQAWFDRVEHETGEIEEVEGRDDRIEGDAAIGTVELKTKRTSVLFSLRFVRESKEWRIAELPEPPAGVKILIQR